MVVVRRAGATGDRNAARVGADVASHRHSVRRVLISASVALVLLLVGEASVAFLPVPVSIEVRGSDGLVAMDDGQHSVTIPALGADAHIRFEEPGPIQR